MAIAIIRYATEVKLFALSERAEGKGWQIIRQRITERFNVPPPTVRAMEKWKKSLNREGIIAELMKDTKKQMPGMERNAQQVVAQNLIPVILSAKDAGEDMETAAWMWFFQWIEKWLGRDRFKKMIDDYFAKQEDKPSIAEQEIQK
ncbi:MAG TPA: hypothetical protein G4O07_01650 [Dehalococcoidia bacterium]|nr:hypothetical protein [Dehalococcoidia bacterium]